MPRSSVKFVDPLEAKRFLPPVKTRLKHSTLAPRNRLAVLIAHRAADGAEAPEPNADIAEFLGVREFERLRRTLQAHLAVRPPGRAWAADADKPYLPAGKSRNTNRPSAAARIRRAPAAVGSGIVGGPHFRELTKLAWAPRWRSQDHQRSGDALARVRVHDLAEDQRLCPTQASARRGVVRKPRCRTKP
jgi:hypothetical protein